MFRRVIQVVCLVLALMLAVGAQAAKLVNSTETVQIQDQVSPTATSAQSNASRVSRMLDNDASTYYSYTAWTSTSQDGIPELTFEFNHASLSEIWLRSGNQASSSDYFANARPSTIRVVVSTYWNSYEYTFAIDDIYDTTTVGYGWMRGYQSLALPTVITDVSKVELYITGWNTGTTNKYAVCLSDILFAGNPSLFIDPSPTDPMQSLLDELDQSMGGYGSDTYRASVNAMLNQRLATRSGPSTLYDELGSYFKEGYNVTALSRAWDTRNNIWWVQVEFNYSGQLRRAYTGHKRVNVDLNLLPEEYALYTARLNRTLIPSYGPGPFYTQHKNSIPAGTYGTVYARENGYAQFEFTDQSTQKPRRVWVPLSDLT